MTMTMTTMTIAESRKSEEQHKGLLSKVCVLDATVFFLFDFFVQIFFFLFSLNPKPIKYLGF
tara:strand:- start:53 stop:238 length:186 start_codon:yes stop_codon:yes gene_type:complete